MSKIYCGCERPEGFAGRREWRTPVHAACGKPNRVVDWDIQEFIDGSDEREIGASVVDRVLRRDREGRSVHANPADLPKDVEPERTSNRFSLPLPDGVWLRYYRDHPDKAISPEHEHLRAEVERLGKPPAR